MFKDDYRKEIDNISASEKFKKDTISLMKERQSELQQNTAEEKTIKFNPKPYRKIAASVAVMLLTAAIFAYSQSDFAIGADQAETENTSKAVETADKDSEYDALPIESGNEKMIRVYTINDAVQLSEIPETEKAKTKIYFDTRPTGSFGFEGFMFYSPAELEQNPTYTVGDSFEALPVYQFTALSAEEIRKEVALNCGKLGSGDTKLEYSWYRNIYDSDGNFYGQEEAVTFSPNIPSNEYRLCSADGTLTQTYPERKQIGDVHVWAPYGWYNVTLDTVVTESRDELEIAKAVTSAYPKLFYGEDTAYGSWYDYTFSGNINRSAFAYKPSKDYGENVFNYTVNRIDISQFPVSAEDSTWKETFIRLRLPCYTKLGELPAIDYKHALGLMYSGNYFSSSPSAITPDTVVSHIELVYLEPPYDIQNIEKRGYSVPFYKFFIELDEDFNRQTENGIMKTYAVCYVCAIHPDHIQLDENYYRFN